MVFLSSSGTDDGVVFFLCSGDAVDVLVLLWRGQVHEEALPLGRAGGEVAQLGSTIPRAKVKVCTCLAFPPGPRDRAEQGNMSCLTWSMACQHGTCSALVHLHRGNKVLARYMPHPHKQGWANQRQRTSSSYQSTTKTGPDGWNQYLINPPLFEITCWSLRGIECASFRRNSGSKASQACPIATRSCANDNHCKLG